MLENASRIRGFDGVRAVAFLLVFVSHKIIMPVTDRYGTAGVWIFFVLSGFLITRILARARGAVEAGGSSVGTELARFYVRRTARIMPVYYVFLGVLSIAGAFGLIALGEHSRQLANWLYVANLYIERRGWGTDLGHLWSLAVEEQFYLLFAPVALLVPARRLWWCCAGLIGLSIAAHVALRDTAQPIVAYDVNSLLNFGLLALGGLAGLFADRPLPAALRTTPAILLAAAGVLVLPALFTGPGDWLFYGRAGGVLTALLIVQIYQAQESWPVAVLDSPPLRGIGLVSYGAYLFHPVIKSADLAHGLGLDLGLSHSGWVACDLALTLVLAGLSWRLMERPVRAAAVKAMAPQPFSRSGPAPT